MNFGNHKQAVAGIAVALAGVSSSIYGLAKLTEQPDSQVTELKLAREQLFNKHYSLNDLTNALLTEQKVAQEAYQRANTPKAQILEVAYDADQRNYTIGIFASSLVMILGLTVTGDGLYQAKRRKRQEDVNLRKHSYQI